VCRTRRPKRELVRVARLSGGALELDESGKGAGRGAYLCARAACWQAPDRDRRLSAALRAPLSEDDRAWLAEIAAGVAARERDDAAR
jgi:predicted RNA-binding protein YlxR (DUF448 family)